MKLKPIQLALLALPLLAASPGYAQDNAPLKINFGYPTADHVNLYVAQDLGLFQKAGLEPKFFAFPSGAPMLAALKSESVDVVLAGLGFAFALGQNIPLKMIYWNSNDAMGEGLVVAPGSAVKSYQDIGKAKKIGAASGTCAQVALYLMAKKVGVDYGKLDIVNIPAPLFRNAFLSGSIDAGIAWSPYSVMLDAQGDHVVNWDTDYTPLGGVCPRTTAVRPAFLKAHPEVGTRLLEVDRLAAQAVAEKPQVAVDALVKRLGLSPDVAEASIKRVYVPRPTIAQQLDPKSEYSLVSDNGLAANFELATQVLHDTKSIPEPVPMNIIKDSIDGSYLKAFAASHGN
jgi:ABC-type nitrate/sulfonate/bicarbonate transport system substrate-binding protein